MNAISYELLRIWLEAYNAARILKLHRELGVTTLQDHERFANLLTMHDRLYKKAEHWEQGDYHFLLAVNHREWAKSHI